MVMFGWPGEDADRLGRLLGLVRRMTGLQKSSMIVRPVKGSRTKGNGEIVVWWKGKQNNGDMMLLLGHLLNLAPGWRQNQLVLKSVVDTEEAGEMVRRAFESMFPDLRMDVRLEVILRPDNQTHREVIRDASKNADLVSGEEAIYASVLMDLLEGLPTTILVRNASRFHGQLV